MKTIERTTEEKIILDVLSDFYREDPKAISKDLKWLLREFVDWTDKSVFGREEIQGPAYSIEKVSYLIENLEDVVQSFNERKFEVSTIQDYIDYPR